MINPSLTQPRTTPQVETVATAQAASCHSAPQLDTGGLPLVAIVGSPNVGKSVLFHKLTGIYAAVSNYPGTTVEVTRGKARLGDAEAGIWDTPGMYNLLPITEEERVARQILLSETPAVVVHVVDAKNLERMLPMTLQLLEAGLPVVLAANLMDEADQLGIHIDLAELGSRLGIPVVGTALALGKGAREIKDALSAQLSQQRDPGAPIVPTVLIKYPHHIEQALAQLVEHLQLSYSISKRSVAMLLLEGDLEMLQTVQRLEGERYPEIVGHLHLAKEAANQPMTYLISQAQRRMAQTTLDGVFQPATTRPTSLASRVSNWMIHPLTGLPILFLVLFILYEFVGVLGAQTLVGWLEEHIFASGLNPWIDGVLQTWIPIPAIQSLLGGEYGLITLGLRYTFAIILPIVGTFFLAFSVIEDSGYLPRLAMLIDRTFKKIGLSGRAVIPMVLGFGCDTMATITTRTLETKRERVIATLLLSLAIPCSAQLGVMLAMFAGQPRLLLAWVGIIAGIFLLVGYLSAQLTPGERPSFYIELPPLRLPRFRNVLVKTYTRMEWYLREVFPLFMFASVVIWIGTLTGLFDWAVGVLVPVVRWLGLPDEAAVAFLFGFFRRDYGAAGLYDMRSSLTSAQLLVAITTMTLFLPCLAQLAVTVKEHGWKTALGMAAFIFPFALLVGWGLSTLLRLLGVGQ